jgi:hypothetical protein
VICWLGSWAGWRACVTGFTPPLMKRPGKGCLFREPISPG